MLASSKRSMNSSTMAASKSSINKPKANEGFRVYLFNKISDISSKVWGGCRKFMWITSTGKLFLHIGLIIIILPFAFGYMMEMQKEMSKFMASNAYVRFSVKQQNDLRGRSGDRLFLHKHYLYITF